MENRKLITHPHPDTFSSTKKTTINITKDYKEPLLSDTQSILLEIVGTEECLPPQFWPDLQEGKNRRKELNERFMRLMNELAVHPNIEEIHLLVPALSQEMLDNLSTVIKENRKLTKLCIKFSSVDLIYLCKYYDVQFQFWHDFLIKITDSHLHEIEIKNVPMNDGIMIKLLEKLKTNINLLNFSMTNIFDYVNISEEDYVKKHPELFRSVDKKLLTLFSLTSFQVSAKCAIKCSRPLLTKISELVENENSIQCLHFGDFDEHDVDVVETIIQKMRSRKTPFSLNFSIDHPEQISTKKKTVLEYLHRGQRQFNALST